MITELWYPTSTSDEDLFPVPWQTPQTTAISKERRTQKALIAALATASMFSGLPVLTSARDVPVHPFVIRVTSLNSDVESASQHTTGAPLPEYEPVQTVDRRGNVVEGATVLAAVSDLQQWLGLNKTQVAELGQFNRRSFANWTRQGAYLSTVRHLMGVHALVSAVVDKLGQQAASTWFASQAAAHGEPQTTLVALLGDEASVNRLARAAGTFIFETPDRQSQFADLELDETRFSRNSVGVARPRRKPIEVARPPRKA